MKNFRRQKTYGSYKESYCPFCNKIATFKNEQGMNVCRMHLKQKFEEIKCTCGSWLEIRSGKFGPYFNCIRCGNINYNKGLAMKEMTASAFQKEIDEQKKIAVSEDSGLNKILTPENKLKKEIKKEPFNKERKEIIISSRDVEYFD